MGIVRMGPPAELVLQLKREYGLNTFVETGTYYGGTSVWAASHFDSVITIECSQEIYKEVVARYDEIRNINFVLGDSRAVLKKIVPELAEPAVFWLDSHWSGGQTYGEDDQCPLIEEIKAVNRSVSTHFLFIDDARLFKSPPPLPNRIEYWPPIDEVIQTFQMSNDRYYIVIFEDVIIAVPQYARKTVAKYCQKANTKAWEEYGECLKRAKESEIRRGCRLVMQGIRMVGRGVCARFRHSAAFRSV